MAHAKAIFLSLVSTGALVLGALPGCNNGTAQPPSTAVSFTIEPGTNSPTVCGVGPGVSWQIGNPESDPLDVIANGTSYQNVPVSVQCQVTANSSGFAVIAQISYGAYGSLTVNGQVGPSVGSGPPATATGVGATFASGSANDFIETLSAKDCTITFTKNGHMGASNGRIWGVVDCPDAASSDGTTCDGNAEFLVENCSE